MSPPPDRNALVPQNRFTALLEPGWPPFSEGERALRRSAMVQAATEHGCDLVIAYGADRSGSAVQWLSGWPVTREAVLLIDARSG